MENWQKDLVDMIENFADETESFFLEMSDLVGAFFEITSEISEQIYASFTEDLNLQDLTEPFREFCAELEDLASDYETIATFPEEIEATPDKNPACVGCRNYHGQAYNGNLLVCAIHPYGYDDVSCPDWENIIE
jgi:hypothetical protein